MNRADLAKLCQLIKSYGISPIVRIPSPDPYLASQAIDAGAVGVVAPYLESVDQIRDLVGAVKYKRESAGLREENERWKYGDRQY